MYLYKKTVIPKNTAAKISALAFIACGLFLWIVSAYSPMPSVFQSCSVILFAVANISEIISGRIVFGLSIVGNKLSVITSFAEAGIGASYIDLVSIIVYLLFGVGLYYATFYVMNKKVNIR